MPASTPSTARSPPVRARPIVTTASVGMASAGSCVVGSMTRSGRSTTQPVATTSTSRAIAARPAQPASSRSSHVPGLRPVAERLVVDRRAEGDDVEQRAGEREDPHRAQEPHGEDVLGPLRPGHDDQDERPEQDGQAERRQDPAEPGRPVGHVGGVVHGRTRWPRRRCRRPRSARPWPAACCRSAGVVPSGVGVVGRRRGRRAEHLEAERAAGAVLAVRLQRRPAHVAGARRHRHEDRHGQRLPVGALDGRRRRSAVRTGRRGTSS